MKELRTEAMIDARPQTVWNVLMDFYSYSEWSPFIKHIEGESEVGSRLRVRMRQPEGKEMTFKPKVLVKEKNKEFRWLGKMGPGGLFNGEHYFIIEPKGEKRTRFVHGERFTGLLVPMLWRSLNTDTRRGFMEFNRAIKERSEKRSGQS